MGGIAELTRRSFAESNRLRAEQEERIDELEHEVESLKKQLQIKDVHAEDDLHRVRSRIITKLSPEVARLEDVLAANSRTPPKTHIVEHYSKETLGVIAEIVEEMKRGNRK